MIASLTPALVGVCDLQLVQAATEVDAMSIKLQAAQIEVDKKSAEVKIMLEEIAVSTTKAEASTKVAQEKEAQIEIDSVRIGEEKAEAEAALEEALPALEEAAQALSDLKKDDTTRARQKITCCPPWTSSASPLSLSTTAATTWSASSLRLAVEAIPTPRPIFSLTLSSTTLMVSKGRSSGSSGTTWTRRTGVVTDAQSFFTLVGRGHKGLQAIVCSWGILPRRWVHSC